MSVMEKVEFVSSRVYASVSYHQIPMYVGALSLHEFHFLARDLRPPLVQLIQLGPE